MQPRLAIFTALMVAALAGCPDDVPPPTSPGPTTSTVTSTTTGAQGGSGGGGGTGAEGGSGGADGGGGAGIVCDSTVGPAGPNTCTDDDPTNCTCLGCVDDGICEVDEDCVCPNCHDNQFCTDDAACIPDGICSPFNEGCACVDCLAHPLCP